ncbi:MAG: D-2-hydroxyacid dehydrogenase [Clostridia bacterium]|nr:D-2-hydroxyacid dehydrogenase [Clostridia bacterium]
MRKLLVNIPQLTPAHRLALSEAAHREGFEAVFRDERADAAKEVADAEILFGPDQSLLPLAKQLRWLCVPSAGAEQYLDRRQYACPEALLTNSAGAYGVTIAEHIVMTALMLMRRQMDYEQVVARRGWRRDLPVRSLHGSRITLLGTGDIGRTAAERLRGFGPAGITGVNRSGKAPEGLFDRVVPLEALEDVLPQTDLLVLSLPHTPRTRGLMDRRRLRLLPPEACLVNVGRGSAIDETALMACLEEGRLWGAALDVFGEEPLPEDSPLWTCPRLLITPHVAGNMTLAYTLDRIVEQFLENFALYCRGLPLKRMVESEKGY